MLPLKITSYIRVFKDLSKMIKLEEASLKTRVYSSIFLTFVTILLDTLSPITLKHLIAFLSFPKEKPEHFILMMGLVYSLSWAMAQVTMQLREILSFKVIERVIRKLALRFFEKINLFPVDFFIEHQLGDLLDTLNKAQDGFSYLISGLFFYLVPTLIEIILACVVLGVLLPIKFTLIFLLMLIAYTALSIWGLEKSTYYQNESIEVSNKAYSFLVDRLSNYETIKSFNQQIFESQQLDSHLEKKEEAQIKASTFIEGLRLGQGAILGCSLILLTLISVASFLNGQMQLESFILVNAYFMQLTPPLNYFSLVIKDIKSGLVHVAKLYDIFDNMPEVFSSSANYRKKNSYKTFNFQNVSFKYGTSKLILQNLDFCLENGKITALVGKTGSGKSTVAKLLLRFYDPSSGVIAADNLNYLDFDPRSIRESIGYVSQETRLFYDTFLYNLTYANPNASKEEIKNAIEKAKLDEVISKLPNGLNTLLGSQGIMLSGGERQRLSLARTFLAKKNLYIFDEATSALDPVTQQYIQEHINSLKNDAAVLLISHRLQTIIKSDEILILSEGSIAEKGDHQSLLASKHIYYDLWQSTSV